jgi:hypothetical protein
MQKLFENWRIFLNEDEKSDLERAQELSRRFSTKEKTDKFDITDLDRVFPFLKKWVVKNPSVPLHIRGYTKYLIGPRDVFTEKDLTLDEKRALGDFLYKIRVASRGDDRLIPDYQEQDSGKNWDKFYVSYQNYSIKARDIYRRAVKQFNKVQSEEEAIKLSRDQWKKFYQRQTKNAFSAEFSKQLQLFLGSFNVTITDSYLYISDRYDFNEDPDNIKSGILQQFIHVLKNYGDDLADAGWLAFIRKMSPVTGVPYQIKIKLPFELYPDTWALLLED